LLHLPGEVRGWALVRIEEKDPWMFEGNGAESNVTVSRVVIEGASVEVGSERLRDIRSGVGAVRIEDVDVVGPGDGI
jgi:hypothetical protein